MIRCDCRSRSFIAEILPGEELSFVAGFNRIRGQTKEQWFDVYNCPCCGSTWCFEDNGRSNLAVRLSHKDDLVALDMEAVYSRYMQDRSIDEYGLANKKCAWKGCYNRALNGKAFCPSHYY
jgi:hypothetical protein